MYMLFCFVLFLTSMLINILYYDQTQQIKSNSINDTMGISLGPFCISSEQIVIGIIVDLLVFIPNLFLVQFFRRIRSHKSSEEQISSLRQTLDQMKAKMVKMNVHSNKKKRSSLIFPWWCLFIAYGVSLLLSIVSIFLVIARGIEFGDLKCQKWLTSLISGFISSNILIQPIKIFLLSIFFACFIRQTDTDEEAKDYLDDNVNLGNLEENEEYLQSMENESPFCIRSETRVNRLNEGEIAFLRDERIKELKMWSIVRDICIYLCFICLLTIVVYSNVNSNRFDEVNHLQRFLLNSRGNENDFTKILTVNNYWKWLEESFVSNVHAQEWYNGNAPRYLNGYINDKTNRLIGWINMKQTRLQSNGSESEREEKGSFAPGWRNGTADGIYSSSIVGSFRYSSDDNDTSNSGGYLYKFVGRLSDIRSNLSMLHQLAWIDNRTREVLIQMNLYNPNVELFTSVRFVVEFLSSGGLSVQSRFEPFTFQVFSSVSELVCSIIYLMLIIYLIIEQIHSLMELKMKYFVRFWSYIDVGIIVCSWTSVGIYVWKYKESQRLGDLFKQTNGYSYVNMDTAVYVDNVLRNLSGFVCYFGLIKVIHFGRLNRRLSLLSRTIQHAGKDLLGFLLMFSIIFFAFLCLFYLLFISKVSTCSSVMNTAGMLFAMASTKYNIHALVDASPSLGPLCFSLFMFLVVFISLSMFVSIVIDSFRFVRDNIEHHQRELDEQILSFMFRRFRRWIGLQRELDIIEEHDEAMRHQYYDPVQQFPDKIDQLLHALNRLYTSQQRHKL